MSACRALLRFLERRESCQECSRPLLSRAFRMHGGRLTSLSQALQLFDPEKGNLKWVPKENWQTERLNFAPSDEIGSALISLDFDLFLRSSSSIGDPGLFESVKISLGCGRVPDLFQFRKICCFKFSSVSALFFGAELKLSFVLRIASVRSGSLCSWCALFCKLPACKALFLEKRGEKKFFDKSEKAWVAVILGPP